MKMLYFRNIGRRIGANKNSYIRYIRYKAPIQKYLDKWDIKVLEYK